MTTATSTLSFPTDWSGLELKWTPVLCIIASVLCLAGIYRRIYRRMRQGSLHSVNCWFCNTTTKVAYSLRNSWTCPSCDQYNGFTKDGDYNKRIIAQSIETLNPAVVPRMVKDSNINISKNNTETTATTEADNGLCTQCNLNQELKIFQLASFVPTRETNFDVEVEEERKRLEEVYSLCCSCQKLVKSKLETIRSKINKNEDLIPKHYVAVKKTAEKNTVQTSPQLRRNGNGSLIQSFPNTNTSSNTMLDSTNHCSPNVDTSASSSMTLAFSEEALTGEFDEVTSLHKLKIGPSPKKMIDKVQFSRPRNDDACEGNSQCFLSHLPPIQKTQLWKDYPLIPGVNQASFGRPSSQLSSSSFTNYRSNYNQQHSISPSYFETHQSSLYYGNIQTNYYRSSSVANIFGGSGKSCLAPAKLTLSASNLAFRSKCGVNNTNVGLYYQNNYPSSSDIFSNQFGGPSSHYLNSNPTSRTSSQSSGFVSQGFTPPPPVSGPNSPRTSDLSIKTSPSIYVEPYSCDSLNSLHRDRLESETCLHFKNGKDSRRKLTRGRKNELSRFGPSAASQKNSTTGSVSTVKRNPKAFNGSDCSKYYSSDSDDEALDNSSKSFKDVKNRRSNAKKQKSNTRKTCSHLSDTTDTEPDGVITQNYSVNKPTNYFTCKRFLYITFIMTSVLLNIFFMSWLIFGVDDAGLSSLTNIFNQSFVWNFYDYYIDSVKPSDYLEWLRHVSNNVTHCVKTNVLF